MDLPYFFVDRLDNKTIALDENTSKHMVQVLRMKKGDDVMVTDGKGRKAKAGIIDDHRKKAVIEIVQISVEESRAQQVSIAISLTKNSARFEWFLEKATELGVTSIFPLLCERTARDRFRLDRMQNILVSAMLQSQQSYLPVLHHPVEFSELVKIPFDGSGFIAHCNENEKTSLIEALSQSKKNRMILIGPEGDFTPQEIEEALRAGFSPVSLGATRLRTETAGIVAASLLCLC